MSNYNPNQIQQLRELGAYLCQQRLSRSLTLEQIATSTFINLSILKALEQGQVDELPELVYVRALLRRYGEALNLDGHSLADLLLFQQVEEPSSEISPEFVRLSSVESLGEDLSFLLKCTQKASKIRKKAFSLLKNLIPVTYEKLSISFIPLPSKLKIYGFVFLLVGAATGLFYLFSVSQSSESSSRNKTSKVVKTLSKKTKNLASRKSQTTPDILESVSPKSSTIPAAQNVSQKSVDDLNLNSDGPVAVSVVLEEDSWMRIKIDGETEYEGILQKGTKQSWIAQKSLIIRAGNAGVVNLVVNNQPSRKLGNIGEVQEVTLTTNN
ncbi:MAG: helix-turn-helix domain-containing protein [cyanobacterium endosymbiont of Rhopalodia musculus]